MRDVHGNVWEWCADAWNDSYEGAPTDGSAWLTGEIFRRVVRGGSWYLYPHYLRSAKRLSYTSTNTYNGVGFRLARTLSLLTP
jgi:formylglycine-generating enzyme required for sulfatase activity